MAGGYPIYNYSYAQQAQVETSRSLLWLPASKGLPCIYWAPQSRCPQGDGVIAYSTEDKVEFAYEAFNEGRDFGPLDLARTVMYCHWVDALLDAHSSCAALVHLASDVSAEERSNSVVLCGAYLVLARGVSAEEAFRPFAREPLLPFVDCRGESANASVMADEGEADFKLQPLEVLRGLEKARDLGWVDYRTFDVEDHASMLRPEHGDMSWLVPGLALALASPWAEPRDEHGLPVCTPSILAPWFLQNNIRLVVQCNDPQREEEGARRRLISYRGSDFEVEGIRHLHIPFEDGGCPSVEIILHFLDVVNSINHAYAVHCRSGLGRTATLIGVFAIQHWGFTARSFIGWARIMRPGTIHGSQQEYLCNLEPYIVANAARTLGNLNQRERLTLLPRRELRFWAADSGIPSNRTQGATNDEIIDMILAAHGVSVSRDPVSPREPEPVSRQEIRADTSRQLPLAVRHVPSSITGLSAALASLNPGIWKSGMPAIAISTPSAASLAGGLVTATTGTTSFEAYGRGAFSELDEWTEVLRYVHLLETVKGSQAAGWKTVRRMVEDLRNECMGQPVPGGSASRGSMGGASPDAEAEAQKSLRDVQDRRAVVARETERVELRLEEVKDETRALMRDCEQLRNRISIERAEHANERKRLEAHADNLAGELRSGEESLEAAVRELESLRGRVFGLNRSFDLEDGLDQRERLGFSGVAAACGDATANSLSSESLGWEHARLSMLEMRDRFQFVARQARGPLPARPIIGAA